MHFENKYHNMAKNLHSTHMTFIFLIVHINV